MNPLSHAGHISRTRAGTCSKGCLSIPWSTQRSFGLRTLAAALWDADSTHASAVSDQSAFTQSAHMLLLPEGAQHTAAALTTSRTQLSPSLTPAQRTVAAACCAAESMLTLASRRGCASVLSTKWSQSSTSSGPKSSQRYLSVSATQKVSMPFVNALDVSLTSCEDSYEVGHWQAR